jgi:hypothetical protein
MTAAPITFFTPITARASWDIDLGALGRAGQTRPMSRAAHFLVRIFWTALAALILNIVLDVRVATAPFGAQLSTEIVDRTLKGARLLSAPTTHPNAVKHSRGTTLPRVPASDLELLDGCEALVSLLAFSPLAHVAARCVS